MSRTFLVAASFRKNDNNTIGAMYRRVAEHWVADGHRVILVNDGRRPASVEHGGRLTMLPWPSNRPTGLRDFLFLRRQIADHRPDCIVSNYGADNLCQVAGWLQRVPCRIVWHHTPTSQDRLDFQKAALRFRFLLARKRRVYRLPTHFLCGSSHTRRDLLETFGVPAEKIENCRYLLPEPATPPLSATERDVCRLVFTGRFHPSKGHEFLIRALPRLVEAFPRLQVDFIGDGPTRTACESLARELGVERVCRFLGHVPHLQDVFENVRRAAVALAPSLDEGFGLILIEALARGTPIVASDIPPFREILVDAEDGFLVPPGDVGALGDRLLRLLGDPGLREQLGRQAYGHFLEKFSADRNAGALAATIAGKIPPSPRGAGP